LASDKGQTRIFYIDGAQPSTAAIHFKEEAPKLTYEVYCTANCDPIPEHVLITEHLGRYLSHTIWKDEKHLLDGDYPAYA